LISLLPESTFKSSEKKKKRKRKSESMKRRDEEEGDYHEDRPGVTSVSRSRDIADIPNEDKAAS